MLSINGADRGQAASQIVESNKNAARLGSPSGFGSGGLCKRRPKEILGYLH